MEVDFPSRHLKKSVLILALRVWIEERIVGGKYVVMHEYYMKDVASKAVLNARSAVLSRIFSRARISCAPGPSK